MKARYISWQAAAALSGSAAASPTFMEDTFTDANDVQLINHTGETGATWTVQFGFTPLSNGAVIGANRMYASGNSSVYQASGTPASADYYVEGVMDAVSDLGGDINGIAGRMQAAANTMYFARFSRSAGGWQLFRTVAGTSAQLGSTYVEAFNAGSKTVRLTMNGSTISMDIDGVERVSVTDTNIATAGKAGVRYASSQTSASGRHLTSIKAVNL